MTIDPPEIVETPAAEIAFIHVVIPRSQMSEAFGPAIDEVLAALAAQGVTPAGPLFAHHVAMSDEYFDMEVGFPVSKPFTASGRVVPGNRPALKVARTTMSGNYEHLPSAWGEFQEWVDAQGVSQAADIWETYVVGPETSENPDDWRTTMERPLT